MQLDTIGALIGEEYQLFGQMNNSLLDMRQEC